MLPPSNAGDTPSESAAHPSGGADAPNASATAATPPEPGFPPALLTKLIGHAPFGLRVTSASGATLYTNRAAEAATQQAEQNSSLRSRNFAVALDEGDYALTIALDETDQMMVEQDLIQRAYFDELTGLPNRALIERSVDALIQQGGARFALAFFDLDGFKHVNDYYGHDVGDKLLEKLGQRLSGMLRDTDMLARLSGDEFVLLLSPIDDRESAESDIHWIGERIKEPFFIDGHEIFTSASIGICLHPEHGDRYEQLRSNADRAMYRGKAEQKGTLYFFDDSIEHAAIERSRLEQRLRLAIRDKRVCCAYQPKVEMRTGLVAGVEVLMRWRDEDGMIQPPGQFLALATELGLMDDLTHFVLAETVESIDLINAAFGRECSISLNVAARQAGDARFMRSLVEAIDNTGFASRFMLELTEEAFLARSDFQRFILPMVREVGARVSIDDFGVGYSSLSALADITADELKVDRSFIIDIHRRQRSQNLLKAIEALGHSLGMSIVVEGVETFEEVAYLQAATRIKYAQGHYFSKPVLLEETRAAVTELDLRAPAAARPLLIGRAAVDHSRPGNRAAR